jgi:hypothetical protein
MSWNVNTFFSNNQSLAFGRIKLIFLRFSHYLFYFGVLL